MDTHTTNLTDDYVSLHSHIDKNILCHTYGDYILIGQDDCAEVPTIHVNADAIMIARAIAMLHNKYTEALNLLTDEEKEYVVKTLEEDLWNQVNLIQ